MTCLALSAHHGRPGVCDRIDARHKPLLPKHVWGDGKPKALANAPPGR
jgi:hypothetical protein